jgi:hypothetical protein
MIKIRGLLLLILLVGIGSSFNQSLTEGSWLIVPTAITEGIVFIVGMVLLLVDLFQGADKPSTARPEDTDKPGGA